MKRLNLILIILGVIAFHGVLFWLVADTNPLPKVRTMIPKKPQFLAREARFVDETTGERIVVREFEVSTKLAYPDVLMEKRE